MSGSGRHTRPSSPTDDILARQASRLSLSEVASSGSSTPKATPSSTQSTSNMSTRVKGYLGNAPKPFNGERPKLIPVLHHVDAFFLMNPTDLTTELKKVLFA